jgi:hypothetical protein
MHFQTVNPLILTLQFDVLAPKNHELLSNLTSSINNNPSGNRQETSANRQPRAQRRDGSPLGQSPGDGGSAVNLPL